MKHVTTELRTLIETYASKFSDFSEDEFSHKVNAAKWSRKEIVGHLSDSAHNNLRRFITGQHESAPPHIVYDQNFWVAANGYQRINKETVIALWTMLNFRIADVLDNMPPSNYSKTCDSGKDLPQLHTLEWLAIDYVKHMKHHINQIIPASFDIIYS